MTLYTHIKRAHPAVLRDYCGWLSGPFGVLRIKPRSAVYKAKYPTLSTITLVMTFYWGEIYFLFYSVINVVHDTAGSLLLN